MENIAQLPTTDEGHEPQQDAAVLEDTPELRDAIKTAGENIAQHKRDRAQCNADIQAELETLRAKGVPKDAIKRALSDADLDEEKLAALDFHYSVCRAALGKPVQGDLFAGTKH